MNSNDFGKFSAAWGAAWAMVGKTITPGGIELAFELLRGYDLTAVMAGLTRHCADPDAGQYPPTPAHVIKHLSGGKRDRAQLAFSKAFKAAGSVGPCESVVFDDPVIHAVIADMGGWLSFCQADIGVAGEKKAFLERDFCQRYETYTGKNLDKYPRKLIGIFESTNRQNGHEDKIAPPTLIGDQSAAKQVYLGGSDKPRLSVMRGEPLPIKALTDGR
jgi:hypothetical protein